MNRKILNTIDKKIEEYEAKDCAIISIDINNKIEEDFLAECNNDENFTERFGGSFTYGSDNIEHTYIGRYKGISIHISNYFPQGNLLSIAWCKASKWNLVDYKTKDCIVNINFDNIYKESLK